jgi:hypothetical protein
MSFILNLKILCVATWSILKAKTRGTYRKNDALKNGHTKTVQRRLKKYHTREKSILLPAQM